MHSTTPENELTAQEIFDTFEDYAIGIPMRHIDVLYFDRKSKMRMNPLTVFIAVSVPFQRHVIFVTNVRIHWWGTKSLLLYGTNTPDKTYSRYKTWPCNSALTLAEKQRNPPPIARGGEKRKPRCLKYMTQRGVTQRRNVASVVMRTYPDETNVPYMINPAKSVTKGTILNYDVPTRK